MSECNCVDTGHKQDCPLGKDLRIAAMQEQIAILETSLAERWENLNVQDGVIEGLREEIASWQRVHRAEYEKREALDARLAALEKVAEAAAEAIVEDDPENGMLSTTYTELDNALREAGYLKEEG